VEISLSELEGDKYIKTCNDKIEAYNSVQFPICIVAIETDFNR